MWDQEFKINVFEYVCVYILREKKSFFKIKKYMQKYKKKIIEKERGERCKTMKI